MQKDRGEKLALIFPVGPMGMYQWAVYFLKEWILTASMLQVSNMDEWSDEGEYSGPESERLFQNAMMDAFYGPLGNLTVPENQRNFCDRGVSSAVCRKR